MPHKRQSPGATFGEATPSRSCMDMKANNLIGQTREWPGPDGRGVGGLLLLPSARTLVLGQEPARLQGPGWKKSQPARTVSRCEF